MIPQLAAAKRMDLEGLDQHWRIVSSEGAGRKYHGRRMHWHETVPRVDRGWYIVGCRCSEPQNIGGVGCCRSTVGRVEIVIALNYVRYLIHLRHCEDTYPGSL